MRPWRVNKLKKMLTFSSYLEGLRLRHFAPDEFTSYGEREKRGVKNGLPGVDLWENIREPAWVLDALRECLGASITIVSCYRSPEYNAKCQGASDKSFHLRNNAIDFKVKGVSPEDAAARLKKFRAAKMFTGGIGVYKTFVHLDAGLRGKNANW